MTTKNIDDLSAAGALAGTDKGVVAQGDAVLKRTTLTAIRDFIAGTLAAVATSGAKADVGLGNVQNVLHNFTATTDPSASNDNGNGYSIGSFWLNQNTGDMWRARDVSAGAAKWARLDSADFYGYVANRWYWLAQNVTHAVGAALSTGTTYLCPFVFKQRATLSDLGIRVTTAAAGGNLQLALYKSLAATGLPGTLIDNTASLSTTSATVVSGALGSNQTLESGLYWAALAVDATADSGGAKCLGMSLTQTGFGVLIGSDSLADLSVGNTQSNQGVTAPDTFGSWSDLTGASFTFGSNNKIPIIAAQIASVP
jgi:hypothetical protein